MEYYSLQEARNLIKKAGLELVEKKLIARTWGNISARIGKDEMLITPSGIPYNKITDKNLVIVRIDNLNYYGSVKPSGEKKVHAAIYRNRDDVRFIIHTHQDYATAISVDGIDKAFAPVAKYGLPSTKKLVKNVEEAVNKNKTKDCILMQRHGAIIMGHDYKDVFAKAIKLEALSKELYERVATVKTEKQERKPYLDDYAQMFGFSHKATEEDKEAVNMIIRKNTLAARFSNKLEPMKCLDVRLQHFIYKKKYSKLKDKE